MIGTQKISIRTVKTSDLDALVHINSVVWHTTYDKLYPESFIAEQSPEKMRHAWERTLRDMNPSLGWFVAEIDNKVIAYAGTGRVPDMSMEYQAELYSIYVLPSHQGLGAGSKLLGELARFLQSLGANSLLVWIAEGNPYTRFYEKHQATKLKNCMEVNYGEKAVPVIAYGWLNLEKLTLL